MKHITLIFDFWNHKELRDYLMSLNGVKDVKIDDETTLKIDIEYDGKLIFPNVLRYEILAFMEVNYPALVEFDLHDKNAKEYKIVIKDMCCEFCYMNMIDELFSTKGIVSAKSNYEEDTNHHYDINLFIEYDPAILSKDDLIKLETELNR